MTPTTGAIAFLCFLALFLLMARLVLRREEYFEARRKQREAQMAEIRAKSLVDVLEQHVGALVISGLGGREFLTNFFLVHQKTVSQRVYLAFILVLTKDSPREAVSGGYRLLETLSLKFTNEWNTGDDAVWIREAEEIISNYQSMCILRCGAPSGP